MTKRRGSITGYPRSD